MRSTPSFTTHKEQCYLFRWRDLESELELNFPVYMQNLDILEWFESIFPAIPLKTVSLLLIYVNFPGTGISMRLYVAYPWHILEEQPTECNLFSLLSLRLIFLHALSPALFLRILPLSRSVVIWEIRAQILAMQAGGAGDTCTVQWCTERMPRHKRVAYSGDYPVSVTRGLEVVMIAV